MDNRRLRDAALLLPLGGALLFLPPYVQVFDQGVTILGVPLLQVYLFGIWLLGIVLTALLSRQLVRRLGEPPADDGQDARQDVSSEEPPPGGG